jgi:hypothetical protein
MDSAARPITFGQRGPLRPAPRDPEDALQAAATADARASSFGSRRRRRQLLADRFALVLRQPLPRYNDHLLVAGNLLSFSKRKGVRMSSSLRLGFGASGGNGRGHLSNWNNPISPDFLP